VPYKLDLNHDDIADFILSIHTFFDSGSGYREFVATMTVRGAQKSNAAAVGSKGYARVFGPGIPVGPKVALKSKALMGHCLEQSGPMTSVHTSKGNWLDVRNRDLGLKFTIKGKIHFGWERLSTTACAAHGTLRGYAYETIPVKPIVTGKTKGPDQASIEESNTAPNMPTSEPVTLSALAMGTPGLSSWRRKEN
jgi:hypothetical protein